MLAASPQCQECMVKQYFRYAAGRTETPADRPLIRSVSRGFPGSGFQLPGNDNLNDEVRGNFPAKEGGSCRR